MTIQGRTQAYGAGNKTYGFGRSNPTSGPVDKLGYKERDLSQNTFQSALARRSGGAAQQPPQQQNGAPQPQSWGSQQRAGVGQVQAAATNTGTIGTSITPMHTQPPAMQSNPLTAPITPPAMQANPLTAPIAPPTMQSNPLTAPIQPAQNTSWGPEGHRAQQNEQQNAQRLASEEAARQNLNQVGDVDYQNALSRLNSDRSAANTQYATGVNDTNNNWYSNQRDVNHQAVKLYDDIGNNYASRGMGYSGGYATAYGNAHNDVARQLEYSDEQKNSQLNQLLGLNAGANQQYNTGKMAANDALARRLSVSAGQLGLDKTTKDPVAEQLNNGEHGGLDRPLPPRSAAIDKSIKNTPSREWTDRQIAYAAKYNLQGRR